MPFGRLQGLVQVVHAHVLIDFVEVFDEEWRNIFSLVFTDASFAITEAKAGFLRLFFSLLLLAAFFSSRSVLLLVFYFILIVFIFIFTTDNSCLDKNWIQE